MEMHSDDSTTIYAWPTCAKCSQPRQTICPYCGTAGHDFGPAYGVDPDAEAEAADRPDRIPVLCPTCDEAFWTRFHARCAWCGHTETGNGALPSSDGSTPAAALAKVGELLPIGAPDRTAAGVGLPIHKPTRGRGSCGNGCGCAAPVQEAHRAAQSAAQVPMASPFAILPGSSSSDDAPRQLAGPPAGSEGEAESDDEPSVDDDSPAEPFDGRTLEEREANDQIVAQRSAILIGIMSLGGAVLTLYMFWIGSR